MAYKIEHIGISVSQPIEMASWYRQILGFEIIFSSQDSEKAVAFISDSNKTVVLEFGKIPGVTPLQKCLEHHLQFHIALTSDDPDTDANKLVQKGAKFIEKCPITRDGDYLIVLEDPWGNCIQLAKRASGRDLLSK
jgi:glyoxylase I family protein